MRALGWVAAGLAAGMLAPSATAREECCAPVKVAEELWGAESESYGVMASWLATDGLGGVYLSWTPIADTRRLAVSRDDGWSWDAPLDRLAGNAYWTPALDSTGTLLLAYRQRDDIMARVSHDQARSFSTARRVASAPSVGSMAVAVGPPNMAAIAWSPSSYPLHDPTDGAWAVVSTDHGDTWSTPAQISHGIGPIAGTAYDVCAVVSPDGSATVAWREFRDDGNGVWWSRSDDGGRTWSPDAPLQLAAGGWMPIHVALGSSGGTNQHAIVVSSSSGLRVRVHASTSSGATWIDSGLDEPINDEYEGLQSFATPDGRIALVTVSSATGGGCVVSDDHGLPGTWRRASGDWSVAGESVHSPAVGQWADGSIGIAHDDYRDNSPCAQPGATCESIYLARSCDLGATWISPDVRLDDDTYPLHPHSEEPLVAFSSAGRLHVVWSDADRLDSTLAQIHYAAVDPPVVPDLDIPSTVVARSACEAPAIHVEARVLSLGPCGGSPAFEWFEDGISVPGATGPVLDVPAATAPGDHVYSYRLACSPSLACGERSPEIVVHVDPPPPAPIVSATQDAGHACGTSRYHLDVEHFLTTCSTLAYQWLEDGAPVAGATGPTLDVPPDHRAGNFRFACHVRCDDAPPCIMASNELNLAIVPPAGAVLGGELAGLIFVRKEPPGDLVVSWSDASPAASGYHAYAGGIGDYYSHAARACRIAREPSGPTGWRTAVPAANTYYLVVPADCGSEGSVGSDSRGTRRPQVASGAPCGPIP